MDIEFQQLFELNPEPMCVIDGSSGRVCETNHALLELLGVERDVLLTRGLDARWPEALLAELGMLDRLDGREVWQPGWSELHLPNGRRVRVFPRVRRVNLGGSTALLCVLRADEDAALAKPCGERHGRAVSTLDPAGEGHPIWSGVPAAELGSRWLRVIGEAEADESGRVRSVGGALQRVDEAIEVHDATRKLAERLKNTLENMGDAFFTVDRDWRFSYVNREFERVIGRSSAELLGHDLWEAFPDAVDSDFERRYREALRSGQAVRFEAQYAGSGQWLSVSAFPSTDGLAVYFRDISDGRMREQEMRLVQEAMSRISDLVIITEADTIDDPAGPKIVYVNEAFERRTGYARQDAIGQTPRLLQGPDTQRDELDRIRTALQARHRVRAELINYGRDRLPFWLEVDIVPLLDAEGRCTHFVAVERDVSERKQAEKSLRLSEERFQLAARATNDVIWDYEIPNNRLWWNENMHSVFGYPLDSLQPGVESWTEHIHPDDVQRVVADVDAAIRGSDESWVSEYRFLRADGSSALVIDRGYLHRDAEGRPLRMIGSMIDISDRLAQEERQRQSQRLETVGQLTGGVAHDFNNLLTVIIGHGELLAEHLGADSVGLEMASTMLRAAERGAELTSRLLAVARKQPLAPQGVDCNRLLNRMLGLLKRTLNEDVELKLDCASNLWLAEVDPGQLEVALLNLALNARDAMPNGGRLMIECGNVTLDQSAAANCDDLPAGPYVLLALSDTGHGIPAEQLGRVFEPFFTTKPVGKGSGLGLSMVYGFVRQSGGTVKIDSEYTQGTRVRIYLPKANAPAELPEAASDTREADRGDECVLVVEDDPHVRRHVEGLLRGLGYRVLAAEAAAPALDLLQSHPEVDLLFTDVVMPGGMNGADLATAAVKMRPALKLLFTSGYTEDALIHRGRLDPGVHLLSKPYRRRELAAKLREVLDAATQTS